MEFVNRLIDCLQSIVGPVSGSDAESVGHGDDTQTSEDPKRITTAVFYSITSTQRGAFLHITGVVRHCLQCFESLTLLVGCQEQHPACKRLSDDVLGWLSVWSKVKVQGGNKSEFHDAVHVMLVFSGKVITCGKARCM